jgi:hypothetical protein
MLVAPPVVTLLTADGWRCQGCGQRQEDDRGSAAFRGLRRNDGSVIVLKVQA